MTSIPSKAASASAARKQPGTNPGAVLLDALTSTPNLVMLTTLTVAFVAAFWHVVSTQGRISLGSKDWNHSYFVPLISAWLVWQHRAEISRIRPTVFWPGVAPLLLGLASYPTSVFVFKNHMAQGYSLILTLLGATLLLLGPKLIRYTVLPIAYMVFAVTLPDRWMQDITFELRGVAATGGYVLLQALGTEVDLRGNTLEITTSAGVTHPLDVADACSGMSMVIAFLALGTAMALVGLKEWWQRVVLVMLAVPVAVLLNMIRIGVLGMAVQVNPEFAAGEAHMLIGTLLLVPGFFLYLFIVWALKRSVREPNEAAGSAPVKGKAA